MAVTHRSGPRATQQPGKPAFWNLWYNNQPVVQATTFNRFEVALVNFSDNGTRIEVTEHKSAFNLDRPDGISHSWDLTLQVTNGTADFIFNSIQVD
ncbi:hypothetical protein [Streptomyces sp. NPDC093707]|uniref:hypothetical protein n=1 Tax=Streptomyces sp. NPDC093707 TaxID=3154984 RepID=UPI00344FC1B8